MSGLETGLGPMRRRGRRWAWLGGIAVLGVAGLLALIVTSRGWLEAQMEVATRIESARPWLALWRAGLFVLLIGGWRYWVGVFAARGGWTPARRDFVLSQRWRVAAWLIVIELLLGQNVVSRALIG